MIVLHLLLPVDYPTNNIEVTNNQICQMVFNTYKLLSGWDLRSGAWTTLQLVATIQALQMFCVDETYFPFRRKFLSAFLAFAFLLLCQFPIILPFCHFPHFQFHFHSFQLCSTPLSDSKFARPVQFRSTQIKCNRKETVFCNVLSS
jgi:hypothetical protein